MKKIFFIAFCAIILSFIGTQETKAQEQIDLTYYYTASNATYYLWMRVVGEQVYIWNKGSNATNWTAATNVSVDDDTVSFYHGGSLFHIVTGDDMDIVTLCNFDCSYQWDCYYYENN